ncbi:hypothetical protein BpHYR1_022063 [Brachionus plicatilis]|uniref:Uncharacterized protein n=1 Tax=Brachionus plicatilis TaxID=10195 RepID=A0A3M7PJU4_BRAPC|nr:hypothetical protein BpHYR1_022063 [Brachionus plicatilis]
MIECIRMFYSIFQEKEVFLVNLFKLNLTMPELIRIKCFVYKIFWNLRFLLKASSLPTYTVVIRIQKNMINKKLLKILIGLLAANKVK